MRKLTLMAAMVAAGLSGQALAENIAIVGGKVHTLGAKGSLDLATVLVSDGKIQQVKAGEHKPEGYRVIDASGKVVTPGIIGAYTSLGLVEVNSWAGVVDATAKPTGLTTSGAALDASYGINPDSTLINISRVEGVTSAATNLYNTETMFQGQGSIIDLGNKNQPLIKARAFVAIDAGDGGAHAVGDTRAAFWPSLENAIAEVKAAKGKTLSPFTEWHGQLTPADIKALQPVVEGKTPLLMDARKASDIRQVIGFKKRHSKINVVLVKGIEAWRVADELAAAGIPVILDPESNLPFGFDELGATLTNAARLQQAGVKVAIGMETHNIRLSKQHAGNAVANGLPWEQGLAALTRNVAEIYGIDKDYGTLEQGKVADVVVWSGDPLEVMETAETVIINGEQIEMTSRQTKLRDRYLDLKQDKPFAYKRP